MEKSFIKDYADINEKLSFNDIKKSNLMNNFNTILMILIFLILFVIIGEI